MSVRLEGLEVLKRKQARLEARIEKARATITAQEILLEETEIALSLVETEIHKAQAKADADTYPVGTRVRHYVWGWITGTVVEGDGTGIAVQQDNPSGHPGPIGYGYSKVEWEVI